MAITGWPTINRERSTAVKSRGSIDPLDESCIVVYRDVCRHGPTKQVFDIEFEPRECGKHELAVRVCGHMLPGCPIQFQVSPGVDTDLCYIEATDDCATHAGVPSGFVVYRPT